MRDDVDFIIALIFRSQAIFLIEAEIRSKNRRLEKVILIGTQRLSLARAILLPLSLVQKGHIIRPSGQL